jgi:hypothetical protein
MTNYSDLVQRLRGVTEKTVPKLRSTIGINPRYEGISIWSEKILNNPDGPAAADAIEAQAKRIEELEAVLKRSAFDKIAKDMWNYGIGIGHVSFSGEIQHVNPKDVYEDVTSNADLGEKE